jgi:hypothetical protein
MKMDKSIIRRSLLHEDKDDGYINADKAILLSAMWDITQDAWAFVRETNAKQRLQRDVGKLIKAAR